MVSTQTETSKLVVENGQKTILLSDSLPGVIVVYGALIAKEAAALMYADMPACAERSYMRRGIAGRVWLELGGMPATLPVVAALSGEIYPWIDAEGAETALYKIGEAEKLSSLPDLVDAVKDAADRAKLKEANARFVAFLVEERPIRKAAGLR